MIRFVEDLTLDTVVAAVIVLDYRDYLVVYNPTNMTLTNSSADLLNELMRQAEELEPQMADVIDLEALRQWADALTAVSSATPCLSVPAQMSTDR